MSHLGQRLSALIDGELEDSDRERVLMHLARCRACRDEIVALRTLKRRMNALGEAAAGAGLTGRLMDLQDDGSPGGGWPHSPGSWLSGAHGRGESRTGWYVLVGSLAAVVTGLGTAAFIVGGDAQVQTPEPSVTPSVDVYTVQHYIDTGWAPADHAGPVSGGGSGVASRAGSIGHSGVAPRPSSSLGMAPRAGTMAPREDQTAPRVP